MGGIKKEYLLLSSESESLTVLGAAVLAFAACPRVSLIAITVPLDAEKGEWAARKALPESLFSEGKPQIIFVPGGLTRRMSVHHALSTLAAFLPDYVLIHDGARPWISGALIDRTIDAVPIYKAVVPVMPLNETPKELDENGFVRRHLKRATVRAAQTPQAFSFKEIVLAHEKAAEQELLKKTEYTDDAEIWGEFIGPVATIEGEAQNKKITWRGDIDP
jgi:2-C-methyl-D-erythritol 4-phosphate cytidylyltransferase